MIVEIVSFVIVCIIVLTLSILLVLEKRIKVKSLQALIKSEADKQIISLALQNLVEAKEISNVEQTEGFLKFVSDSRDWAFQYIEDVQAALSEFEVKISPQLEYVKAYGETVESGAYKEALKLISEAYSDLQKVLPKSQ